MFKCSFHRLLIKHSLVKHRQLGYFTEWTLITTTVSQRVKWRWSNQTISDDRKYHGGGGGVFHLYKLQHRVTGWTENKYITDLHQILGSSEGQQQIWLLSRGRACTTHTRLQHAGWQRAWYVHLRLNLQQQLCCLTWDDSTKRAVRSLSWFNDTPDSTSGWDSSDIFFIE